MNVLIPIFVFIFGAIIGSFLNVLILRWDTKIGFLKRSHCMSCKKPLSWHELIPIVSFIIQKGRCRSCKKNILWQYPIVEILTGVIFLLIFNFFAQGEPALGWQFTDYRLLVIGYYWLIFSILITIAVYDFHHKIIPNTFVYLFDILALLYLFGNWKLPSQGWSALGGGLIFFLFFASLWFISRGRWMGLGDAKLALGIGWLLGLSQGMTALIVAFWVGAIVGLLLLFLRLKKHTIKSEIPFAPFLVFGTFVAFYFDLNLMDLQSLFMFIL